MDAVDIEILRRVAVGPFVPAHHAPAETSASGLAKALKVSVETVRRRLAGLEKRGVLAGPTVWPNFRLLGLCAGTYHFAAGSPSLTGGRLQAVAKIDGVIDVFAMLGGDVCVDLCSRDDEDLEQKLAEIRNILGTSGAAAFFEYPLPAVGRSLSATDWRILAAMRAEPSASYAKLARSLKLSHRTVKRRADGMRRDGTVEVVQGMNPARLDGHFLVWLLVRLEPDASRTEGRSVVNAFRSRWLAQWSPPDDHLAHLVIVLAAPSAGAVEDLRREAESLGVVAEARALVFYDAASETAWLDGEIAEKAKERSTSKRERPVAAAPTAAQP